MTITIQIQASYFSFYHIFEELDHIFIKNFATSKIYADKIS